MRRIQSYDICNKQHALHALGLKSDEQAEEFNKKHMMKIVDMYTRRGYDITK